MNLIHALTIAAAAAVPAGDDITDRIFANGFEASPALLADHAAVAAFAVIPDAWIEAAGELPQLFRHASVGDNIRQGLSCLMNDVKPRPNFCDRETPPNQIVFDPKYDYHQWQFEFHSPPPGQNPPWWDKVGLFVDRVDGLEADDDVVVVSFKFGYVDGGVGSNIDSQFFADPPNPALANIADLEALAQRHPDKLQLWWTMGLARQSHPPSQGFNQQLRQYAATRSIVLFDIADILSTDPSGLPCVDNQGSGIEAICADYTNEVNGGHLNSLGRLRMAKAYWWLMARIAGWDGAPR